jgi:hypothetical protein
MGLGISSVFPIWEDGGIGASGDCFGGGTLKVASLGRRLISAILGCCFAATDVAGLGFAIKSGRRGFFLRWIGGALGSLGFLVLLGFDVSVFVAELPSGWVFGLLRDPGLRPGFFRAGGCCATENLLGLALLKICKIMRKSLHTLNTKSIHRES